MMPFLKKLKILWLMAICALYPAGAIGAVAPIAFFPLQDLSQGRNGINMPFTKYLAEHLEESGTEILSFETIVAFMANNRIRSPGKLETYHINRVREELGAAYILLGTVIQKKEFPKLSLGLTLNLIRTYDARTVWSYAGAFSSADFHKLLAIGEPSSIEDLQTILIDDIMSLWPGSSLNREEQISASIDSIVLKPARAPAGTEIHSRVNLRNLWVESRAPRVFFKADDQIHAATVIPSSNTYQASWVAGEKDGRYPVSLIVEWPFYGRTETFELGTYVVDSVLPLIALDLKGETIESSKLPVFSDNVIIVPRKLIRKPIAHWRITFLNSDDLVVASQKSGGELPDLLVWGGWNPWEGREAGGEYKVRLEVWDEAGNKASASDRFEFDRSLPVADVAAEKKGREVLIDLQSVTKVPLAFWRLEMWSKEGKLVKQAEGEELPAQIGLELDTADEDQTLEGTIVLVDVLGNKRRQEIKDLLGMSKQEKNAVIIEEELTTKSWVEDF